MEQATSQEPTLSPALGFYSLDTRTLQATYSHSWPWAKLNTRYPKGSVEKQFLHGSSGMTSFPTNLQQGKKKPEKFEFLQAGCLWASQSPAETPQSFQAAPTGSDEAGDHLDFPRHSKDAGRTEQGDPKTQRVQVSVCIPAGEWAESKESGRRQLGAMGGNGKQGRGTRIRPLMDCPSPTSLSLLQDPNVLGHPCVLYSCS